MIDGADGQLAIVPPPRPPLRCFDGCSGLAARGRWVRSGERNDDSQRSSRFHGSSGNRAIIALETSASEKPDLSNGAAAAKMDLSYR